MADLTGPDNTPLPAAARWSTPISLIRLEGADARRFLHGQSSQAIELAPPGSCVATCLISPTARMRALALACIDASGIDLLVVAGDGGEVHQALDRVLFPADRVRLSQPLPATLVRWLGPTPETIEPSATARLLRPGVDLGTGRHQPALLLVGGSTSDAPQTDIHGYPQQEAMPPLPAWLNALPELTPDQRERQRLRQGFPAHPGELNDSTNPFELGLAEWVSLNKGCYVGQETLAKLATYDGVKQQLRHWRAPRTGPAAADACAPGTPLITTAGGRAGVITSMLSTSEGLEGLALVRRTALENGELLAGESTAEAMPLEIHTPTGFVAPPLGAGGSGTSS